MRFKIGQKVAVLDDVLKGEVISINSKVIEIQDDEGMKYKFDENELVSAEKEQYRLTKLSDINNPLFKEKYQEETKKKTSFIKPKEVDLHNYSISTTKNRSNHDILTSQLDKAKQELEYAVANKISKIIFIHGEGKGKLKAELRHLLKKYPVKFYDASYQKYKSGATEVYIPQNSKS